MKRSAFFALLVLAAFSLVLMAGSCDVEKKTVKLSDLDKKYKKYENTEWDGLKKKKVRYVVSDNKKVDEFSKDAAMLYASYIQADFIADKLGNTLTELRKKKDKKTEQAAKENAKIAKKVLKTALKSAKSVYASGESLVKDYKSLVKDVTKAPAIGQALNEALKNISKVIKEGPETVNRLTHQAKKLAEI
mgnify:CR=1 FL=1